MIMMISIGDLDGIELVIKQMKVLINQSINQSIFISGLFHKHVIDDIHFYR